MNRIYTIQTIEKVGESVLIKGWVHARRDMGKIVFIDLRDKASLLQVVLTPGDLSEADYEAVKQVRPEWVVEIAGQVQKRGAKQVNKDLATGTVEVLAKSFKVLNQAATPPFEIDPTGQANGAGKDIRSVNEETRLKYRYLDLRSKRMHNNIILRHNVIRTIREYLYGKGFTEIETPFLTKSTPEGARDFLVPSRNYPGKFYALPQSPQQYKQLLMIAGFEQYFQIVRCFRDEDQRGDRQAEFTQLDMEVSFVTEEDIMVLVENLVKEIIKTVVPEYKLTADKFPRLTYDEAMKDHGNDRPDLRKDKNDTKELAFVWVTDFPMFEYKAGGKRWGATHHPFTAIRDEDLDKLGDDSKMGEIKAKQYDLVLNGNEIAGGSIRTHDPEILKKVFQALKHSDEEIQNKFGHLLEAFKYGVPPHGGIAFGLDRFLMVLAGEDSIREVMAFPKTSDNRDPLMDSPAEVSKDQLDELGLLVMKKNDKK